MLKRLLITIFFLGICINSFSYQLLNEKETTLQQKQLAATLVEKAKKNYLNKVQGCLDASKKNSLTPQDFSAITLDEKELKTVILYFSAKTLKACAGEAEDNYLMAEMVAREFKVDGYSLIDDPDAGKILATGAALSVSLIKYMPDYLAIDAIKREKLEKIPSLNTVFDIESSITNLLEK